MRHLRRLQLVFHLSVPTGKRLVVISRTQRRVQHHPPNASRLASLNRIGFELHQVRNRRADQIHALDTSQSRREAGLVRKIRDHRFRLRRSLRRFRFGPIHPAMLVAISCHFRQNRFPNVPTCSSHQNHLFASCRTHAKERHWRSGPAQLAHDFFISWRFSSLHWDGITIEKLREVRTIL